jgi:hypothetical protein
MKNISIKNIFGGLGGFVVAAYSYMFFRWLSCAGGTEMPLCSFNLGFPIKMASFTDYPETHFTLIILNILFWVYAVRTLFDLLAKRYGAPHKGARQVLLAALAIIIPIAVMVALVMILPNAYFTKNPIEAFGGEWPLQSQLYK